MKGQIGKPDFLKLKNIYSSQDTIEGMKRQVTMWEKTFAKHTHTHMYTYILIYIYI